MYPAVFRCILLKYCILAYSDVSQNVFSFAIQIHCAVCILMYPECILNVSYAEDEIHRDTRRIHHDTRIHPLTHGPTRAPLGYSGIRQDTTGYIRSSVSPQVAHDTSRYGWNTKKISYPRRILLIAPALLALLPKGQQALQRPSATKVTFNAHIMK